jgi:hypothetical protein
MKRLSGILSAAGLVLGLALVSLPAAAQQTPALAKPASPAAVAAAKEILAMKNASGMYASAVPNIVQQSKNQLIQSNLNYQKDLNDLAPVIAQKLAGSEKQIGDGMAQIYAQLFTEQELKDLVTFYKTPLGQKLLANEPKAIETSMAFLNQWAQGFGQTVNNEFRAEMLKRGKKM